jgi:hypothetical protein
MRRLTESGGVPSAVVSTNKSQTERSMRLLRLRQFYTDSRLMTQGRSMNGALCRTAGSDSQLHCNFLSLVNALFTTLGEMWARRLPVVILYRTFHGFSERG